MADLLEPKKRGKGMVRFYLNIRILSIFIEFFRFDKLIKICSFKSGADWYRILYRIYNWSFFR